ncbi:MAG: alanine--tRNA ligase [Candidatus Pacebacteria bacterium]|nr:alanine--tRNA ligase [Candidatus Paceibacterota bacterium]
MQSEEIRSKFLEFFKKRDHMILPSASLLPENDPSVLFTTAGMQPLVPFLLGRVMPTQRRLANIQKCVRTQDIDEVGDNTHNTFFEMLGNWSLGDYFKKDAISWTYEFFTSKEAGLGLDPNRIYVTCFEGDENAPKDTESAEIWESIGIPKDRIYFLPAKNNWWQAGENGPCGPDTEIFYDLTKKGLGKMTKEEYLEADNKQEVVEIGNDVFMGYEKKNGVVVGKLKQQNVDFGGGFERLCMVSQGVANVFATDLFQPIMAKINEFTTSADEKAKRIVADHIRTAVFMIGDGVIPSNTDAGYILRRLLRRAVRFADKLEMKHDSLSWIAETVIEKYTIIYDSISKKRDLIRKEIDEEEQKFRKTLASGLKLFEKISEKHISGEEAFDLFSSHGFPLEVTLELAKEEGKTVDVAGFNKKFKEHQELSRKGAEQKFKGGLAGHSDKEVQYHTATHLLNSALRKVLGAHVEQKGSNITPDRLRFDFIHTAKMTDEEKKQVEEWINAQIKAELPVSFREMPIIEAKELGAIGVFEDKYGEVVKVYSIGNEKTGIVSMELCGGPHVSNTSELKGTFKIQKEEAVSAGVRRIKAVLE